MWQLWPQNFNKKVSFRIQSECGKIQSRITPNTNSFYAVQTQNLCKSHLNRFNAYKWAVQFSKDICDRNRLVLFIWWPWLLCKYRKFQSRIISCSIIIVVYHFSNKKFRKNLLHNLSKVNHVNDVDGFQKWYDIGLETLSKHAPCKQKYVWSNQMPFFTKELSKAIKTRSRLWNNYLKNRDDTSRLFYTKQKS